MAGTNPAFVTGANARIKINTKTMAYAQDVSYQIIVDTIAIETMGRYEAVSNEPVNYSVSGELSIIRYTKAAMDNGAIIAGSNSGGNNVENIGIGSHFDPSRLLQSETVSVEIFDKRQAREASGAGPTAVAAVAAASITKVIDCRFTRKSAGINKRGVWVERLSFVGILGNDDGLTAAHSGDIDLA